MDNPKTHQAASVAAETTGWKIMLPVVGLLGWLLTWPALAQTGALPALQITASNGVATVSWPVTAYEDILQTTTDLSPAGTWTNLVTGDQIIAAYTFYAVGGTPAYLTNVFGDQIVFSLPATNGQQFYRLVSPQFIPACGFAVFYNGLLEFSMCAPMVVNGRVHANGPIDVGTISSSSLTFNAPVTTTSNLAAPYMDGATAGTIGVWNPADSSAWNTTFNGNPGYITNVASLAIPLLNSTNYHLLIDIPTSRQTGANANISTNAQMLYNQAEMVLLVTNSTSGTNPAVTVILQAPLNGNQPGNDPNPTTLYYTNASPASLSTNLPFLTLTNTMYDDRESNTNTFTQIDVAKLATWLTTSINVQNKLPASSGVYPTILYVADRRTQNSQKLPSVRLMDAAQLPANNGLGFTVATPNPLYVQGNYNTQTTAGSSLGTNNAYEVPAALLSDALTILSPNWTDNKGALAYTTSGSTFTASTMTINAAIVTGTVPSTGASTTTFSGGVHNLPRMLENWTGVNLYLNTSIIRLWDSQMATNQWKYQGTYYNPPNRFFSFDNNYLDPAKVPPGIPVALVPLRFAWTVPPPATINWTNWTHN